MASAAPLDGVLQLDAVHKDLVHESFTCDTRDHEDHTFCGMMFDVQAETGLPMEYVEVSSLSVRGDLGPLTVWTTPDTIRDKHESQEEWKLRYSGVHPASRNEMVELKFTEPVKLRPGQSCGLYVHSALPGDEAIVYDNQRSRFTYQDRCFKVMPGLAHLSNKPFGKRGFWGRPWRMNREFVGRISYGVRWKMWSPSHHLDFPIGFRKTVATMIMASRRPESLMYLLHDEIVLFIMNKCWWEWWGDQMEEVDPAEEAAAAAAAAAAASSSSSSRVGAGGGRGGSYHGGGGYPSTFGHSSLYASLLGSMSGHQLSGFTHHTSLGHSGQALDLVESDSDEEYMYTVGHGDGLRSDDESDDEEEEEEEEEEEDEEDEEEGVEVAEGEEEARLPLLMGRRSEGAPLRTSTLDASAPAFVPSLPPSLPAATATEAAGSSDAAADPTADKQQAGQGPVELSREIAPQSVTAALPGAGSA